VHQQGKGWSVAGSTSSVKSLSSETGNGFLAGNDLYTYAAETRFQRFSWRCEIAGRWQWVYTLEPTEWVGGLPRNEGGRAPQCNGKFKATIPPNGHHRRMSGSSTTLDGAIQVAGFTGSATTTTSEGISQYWKNERNEQRYLCGSTNDIVKNTRVYSPA
jgi:hypothetical protein